MKLWLGIMDICGYNIINLLYIVYILYYAITIGNYTIWIVGMCVYFDHTIGGNLKHRNWYNGYTINGSWHYSNLEVYNSRGIWHCSDEYDIGRITDNRYVCHQ